VQRVDSGRAAVDLGLHRVQALGEDVGVARLPRHDLREHALDVAACCRIAGSGSGT
jgi:hypothetical protein